MTDTTTVADYDRARREARKVLDEYGVAQPPVPVRDIIEAAGLDVQFVEFATLQDVAGLTDFERSTIYVNSEEPLNRQTFTMAHEFGHWTLHKPLFLKEPDRYNILLRRGQTVKDPIEQEANAFAAELLVPMNLLKQVKDYYSPSQLADLFAVSLEVIQIRLKRA